MAIRYPIKWALVYRLLTIGALVAGILLVAVGLFAGFRSAVTLLMDDPLNPSSAIDRANPTITLLFFGLGLLVWQFGTAYALFLTLPRVAGRAAANRLESNDGSSDSLEQLDERLDAMESDIVELRREIQALEGLDERPVTIQSDGRSQPTQAEGRNHGSSATVVETTETGETETLDFVETETIAADGTELSDADGTEITDTSETASTAVGETAPTDPEETETTAVDEKAVTDTGEREPSDSGEEESTDPDEAETADDDRTEPTDTGETTSVSTDETESSDTDETESTESEGTESTDIDDTEPTESEGTGSTDTYDAEPAETDETASAEPEETTNRFRRYGDD